MKHNPAFVAKLELRGRERGIVYKTLVLTGLRRGELASLTVSRLHLDGPVAFAELDACNDKNREGSELPLRADLAKDLRHWLADKLEAIQAEARERGEPIPERLPGDTPCSMYHGNQSRRSTGIWLSPAFRRPTTVVGHSTFMPYGILSARCSVAAELLPGQHKPPCGMRVST